LRTAVMVAHPNSLHRVQADQAHSNQPPKEVTATERRSQRHQREIPKVTEPIKRRKAPARLTLPLVLGPSAKF
ncbi:MAG: hypothetical protein M3O31_03015, partial [Acidobacteriota bacterium]|nr:hypothetical protein [Acidobacteriota bacterium]